MDDHFESSFAGDDRERQHENLSGEGTYICDACGEQIVIPLDPLAGTSQKYVEDCPVCCHPSVIHVDFLDTQAHVWAEPEQDRY